MSSWLTRSTLSFTFGLICLVLFAVAVISHPFPVMFEPGSVPAWPAVVDLGSSSVAGLVVIHLLGLLPSYLILSLLFAA